MAAVSGVADSTALLTAQYSLSMTPDLRTASCWAINSGR